MIAEWATSDDRLVTVQAAPGGVPLQVLIEPAALHQRPEDLARLVLDTAARAGRRAAGRLRAELAATVGPEAARTLDRVGLPAADDADLDADLDDYDENGLGGLLGGPR
jgi:hypothetical protein